MKALNWAGAADVLGSPVAGLAILVESAGIPFPGEVILVAASAWAVGRQQPLALVFLIALAGSIVGSDLGYVLGHRGGRPFVERFGAAFHVRPERLAHAELFFARYGDVAILPARFVPGLRTWAAMLAGMARMPFWRFQLFSAAGDLVWTSAVVAAGYLVGTNLAVLQDIVRAIGIGGVVFIAVIATAVVLAQEGATRRR
jgi:membrane protein DedA with SNARE-associated domain